MIGDDIEIIITEISGDKVRLGIKAPLSTTILRRELYQTIEENKIAAHSASPRDLKRMLQSLGGSGSK